MLPNNNREDNLILYEFKNCLLGVLAYVNILNKESFESLILRKDKKIYNHNIINLLYQSQLNNKYMKTTFDNDKNEDFDIDNKMEIIQKIHEDLDFKNEIFPNIINNTKYEIGYNLEIENNKKITLFLSYLQLHFNDIPKKFSENNYSLLFSELIKETEELINLLNNTSILNKFHLKILEGNKLNTIMNYNFLQIKSIQKSICIQYLYNKISFLSKFTFFHKKGLITKIAYEIVKKNDNLMPNVDTIISLIDVIPDFRKYEKYVDDIINLEEKVEFQNALNMYFNDLRKEIINENIIKNFSSSDLNSISTELENYILFKLYDKLYPTNQTKADLDFYNKCLCLNFIKPENLIKNTKIINEKLWKTAINYINEMDEKYTPVEKLKCLGKAISILQNSITFSSGKDELGVDDTIPPLIYILIKSKPKKLMSNYNFCSLFLNPELSKKEMGILLSQIGPKDEEKDEEKLKKIPKDQYLCPKCLIPHEIRHINEETKEIEIHCANKCQTKYSIKEYLTHMCRTSYFYYKCECCKKKIQKNFKIDDGNIFKYCFECNKIICLQCFDFNHQKLNHKNVVQSNEIFNKCSQHPNEDFIQFCINCSTHLCQKCTFSPHKGHILVT